LTSSSKNNTHEWPLSISPSPEELRTPLDGIVATSEELSELIEVAECTNSRPALRDMCNIVVENSSHMLALVNDVLDFEQMDTD
jgi:signal transduction histidine kinase